MQNKRKQSNLIIQSPQSNQFDMVLSVSPSVRRMKSNIESKALIVTPSPKYPESAYEPFHVGPDRQNVGEQKSILMQYIGSLKGIKQIRHFVVLVYIARFVNRLTRLGWGVNETQFQLIDDKASNYETFKKRSKQQDQSYLTGSQSSRSQHVIRRSKGSIQWYSGLKGYISRVISRVPLIEPHGSVIVGWDGLLTGIRVYFLLMIPISLSLGMEFSFINIFFECLMLIDVLLRFNLVYYEEGRAVRNRVVIMRKQLNALVILDCLCLISMLFDGWRWIQALFVFQFRHISNVYTQWEYQLNFSKIMQQMIELLKLIGWLMYLIHVVACIWLILGKGGWLQYYEVDSLVWYDQYIVSFYFSSVTLFTVGYGDISPQNQGERLFCIICMLISSIQFSYSLNTVGEIIKELKLDASRTRQKHKQFNQAVNKLNISSELSFSIRQYLNFKWKSEDSQTQDDVSFILNSLPTQWRNKANIEANQIIFQKCPYFQNTFSIQFQSALSQHFHQQTYPPSTYIEDGAFYFIKSGSLEVIYDNETTLNDFNRPVLLKHQYFNLTQLFNKQPPKEKYKTITCTHLISLNHKDFLQVLDEFPQEKQKYHQQSQDLPTSLSSYLICQACQLSGHQLLQCPKLLPKFDHEKILKHHIFPHSQFRDSNYLRTKRKGNLFNALHDRVFIEEEAQIFQTDNQQQTQLYQFNLEDLESSPLKNAQRLKTYRHNIIVKFKQAAIAIQSIQNFHKNKRNKSMVSTREYYQEFTYLQSRKIQCYKKLNDQLLERLQLIEKYNQLDQSQKMAKQIQDYLLMISKKLQLITGDTLDNSFEAMHNYIAYRPHNNLRNIFNTNPHDLSASMDLIRVALMPYFLYPYHIIQRFQQQQQVSEPNTVKFRRKTRKQTRFMTKRIFPSTRIFPQKQIQQFEHNRAYMDN